jgi:CspA family cold shock protein
MATTFRDTQLTCPECGKLFILTVEAQRRAAEQGQPVPTQCTACTQRVRYRGRLHGRIKWFSPEKGYGFLTDDAGKDIFFHRDGVLLAPDQPLSALEEGQEALFEVIDTSRGPQAVRVELFLD